MHHMAAEANPTGRPTFNINGGMRGGIEPPTNGLTPLLYLAELPQTSAFTDLIRN